MSTSSPPDPRVPQAGPRSASQAPATPIPATGTARDRGAPQAPLAGGTHGPDALRPLLGLVLESLREGAADRGGPFPPGGPEAIAAQIRQAVEPVLPDHGIGAGNALHRLVRAVAYGAADPADPLCAAHLHTPPLALAVAADLAASVLNQSLDSWDQAPAASEVERSVTRALAAEVYPHAPQPDALVTTGGTESNQLALLLARERHGAIQVICGSGSHHSVQRAAWLLGLPAPVTVPAADGALDPVALDDALTELPGPRLVVATAGATDTGRIDPLPEIAAICERHGVELHVDAAYGGPLLFSERHRPLLAGLERADSVTLDLHKLGWQPIAAGLFAVRDHARLSPLAITADYLNPDDDTEAGLPDLLGRSLRTTRRPDVLKIAVTLRSLGRDGMAALVDRTMDSAARFAQLIEADERLELWQRPTLSTVLFRPRGAGDAQTAEIRRTLLMEGRAVLGRARIDGRLWLKATLLNPYASSADLHRLIDLVIDVVIELVEGSTHR
ncbi:pyridoxal phosphate-dependent decarboxylase family protein [Streptomyces albipurpureus]|uniref:Aminotransferase class V-fold PLP-dependent enzyme n=1 Tax=Streptomyces albipurpureus TaxID=2897419 RepID=A0ABT0UR26_9ACTN|nr:aminotransferase class V-fold PLP-dependent enzyme [Streptomyces sp. CWNU-1]MCM2390797.1 aminotransferase class V-fold PLP-dependent enzyme [Streptomyces sp. CWNU-1]